MVTVLHGSETDLINTEYNIYYCSVDSYNISNFVTTADGLCIYNWAEKKKATEKVG